MSTRREASMWKDNLWVPRAILYFMTASGLLRAQMLRGTATRCTWCSMRNRMIQLAMLRQLYSFRFIQGSAVKRLVLSIAFVLAVPLAGLCGGTCPSGASYLGPSGALVTLSSLGITNCYYISKATGSDSNSGTAETTNGSIGPWAHLPSMPSCTANCASVVPNNPGTSHAGTGFILRGGDTWVASDFPMNTFNPSGTSTNPIYIGVDLTWYNSTQCGSSWCRPIFTDEGTVLHPSTQVLIWGSYVLFDDIELTGFATSGGSGGSIVQIANDHSQVERSYFHGWSHAVSGDQDNAFAISGGGGDVTTGSCVHDTVIDGSDTSRDMVGGLQGTIPSAYNNIIRYVTNGIQGTGSNWHDNWVSYVLPCYSGCHQNGVFNFGPDNSATSMFIYNNVISNLWVQGTGGSGGGLWLSGNNANSATGYAFNNVLYGNVSGFSLDLAGHNAVNYGTWYFFNNTMECGTDAAPSTGVGTCGNDSGGTAGMTFVLYAMNNHFIKGDTTAPLSCTYSTCTFTGQLTQTLTTAHSQGYNETTGSFAFSPTSSGGSTVGAGTNKQSLCSTIAGLNAAAGTACQSDTGYACSYNTSNHTVTCPDRTGNARPGSAAWDIGAYQSESSLLPPNNLQSIAH